MVSVASWNNWLYDEKFVFDDVSDKSYWWTKYVCSAKKLWYISSENSYFRPGYNITRAEALKMIMSFKKIDAKYDSKYTFTDTLESDWWTKYISTAWKMQIVAMDNSYFNPTSSITRKEVVKMIYNVFYK